MTKIVYIVHSTTIDNEASIVSGQKDCLLSPLGKSQAKYLSSTLQNVQETLGQIFCSTLDRAKQTGVILFPNSPIHYDPRLMEINYGSQTHSPVNLIMTHRIDYISSPYPNGESYLDVEKRMRSFLEDHRCLEAITLISHQAPQLALEVICNRKKWEMALSEDWRIEKKWQPYWIYEY